MPKATVRVPPLPEVRAEPKSKRMSLGTTPDKVVTPCGEENCGPVRQAGSDEKGGTLLPQSTSRIVGLPAKVTMQNVTSKVPAIEMSTCPVEISPEFSVLQKAVPSHTLPVIKYAEPVAGLSVHPLGKEVLKAEPPNMMASSPVTVPVGQLTVAVLVLVVAWHAEPRIVACAGMAHRLKISGKTRQKQAMNLLNCKLRCTKR